MLFQIVDDALRVCSYVPDFILRDAVHIHEMPLSPIVRKFSAAILFVDVSGFTALNERLARLGAEGPESVRSLLSAVCWPSCVSFFQ